MKQLDPKTAAALRRTLLLPPQAAGMSCYSVAEEITSVCADFLVELRGFEPRCSWRRLRVSAATAGLSLNRLGLEAFAIPERQRDAVAEGIEKVVLAVTVSVANTKALDLVEQVVS
jgi:hypothetical protein